MWWPFYSRDGIAQAFAFDCLNEYNCIIISGKTPKITKNELNQTPNAINNNTDTDTKIDTTNNSNIINENNIVSIDSRIEFRNKKILSSMPAIPKRTVRCELTLGLGAVVPLVYDSNDNKKCKKLVTCVFNVDFKSFLPNIILNWLSRTFSYYGIKMVRNKSENIYNSQKHKHALSNKKIYKKLNQRLIEWNKLQMNNKLKMEQNVCNETTNKDKNNVSNGTGVVTK